MIREFTIAASHTVNLGNYESSRFEASITMSIPAEAGDDDRVWPEKWRKFKEQAQAELNALLKETYQAQLSKRVTRNGKAPAKE